MNSPRVSHQLHQPRLAELVAAQLRQRILDGELADGALLPNQETLLAEFDVSKPSLREAQRILEAEGLITVRRGNVGGAEVHYPESRHAAYTMALVLQRLRVTLDDVGRALKQLEAACTALCASRPDRLTTVVPALRECNNRAEQSLDDELEYVAATADFHTNLVRHCGNTTMGLLVGSLESLWLGHVQAWAVLTKSQGEFPDPDYRRQGLAVHQEITELIAAGEVVAASELAESHFDPQQFYRTETDSTRPVDATVIRDHARRPGMHAVRDGS
jgi:GntR family transcriptional regulator, transcriptional repressor for pyruvate dehydrogenase complex